MAELRRSIAKILPPRLYEHTISVEATAFQLTKLFGAHGDDDAIARAALLHDITKSLDVKQQLILSQNLGIILSDEDIAAPKVIHAMTASEVARRFFLCNDDVCEIIRSHTVGNPQMSAAQKIVFLADCIDPTRDDADCIRIRDGLFCGIAKCQSAEQRDELLDALVKQILDDTIAYLLDNNLPIHSDTVKSRNAFIN